MVKSLNGQGEAPTTRLTICYWGPKTFIGKNGGSGLLKDTVEMIGFVDPNGQMGVTGLLIGDITLDGTCLLGELTNRSIYYAPYFKTSSGLHLK